MTPFFLQFFVSFVTLISNQTKGWCMEMKKNKELWLGIGFIAVFILWTLLIMSIDVQSIGPNGSSVGFATLNGFFHQSTGVHMSLYVITDWLGLVPIAIAFGFAVLGLVQWIQRRKIVKVDGSILALGGFYVVVIAVYVFFEYVVINYRPTLIDGYLEASYPSSTTMLVTCIIPTSMMEFCKRIKQNSLRRIVLIFCALFTAFMVVGRLLSGVHWLTDIIGGVWISIGLVLTYHYIVKRITN